MLLFLLAPVAAEAPPEPPPQPPPGECAIYDLIHRERFAARNETDHGLALRASPGWGEPSLTCPAWKQWDAAPTEVIVFEPVAYARNIGSASVEYTVLHYNHHWDVDRVTGRERWRCRLGGEIPAWRIEGCDRVSASD